ncbi:uncharacterized protein V1518DRAFT_422602 [Limtongia smithiae]|uniref:uncharacterized protein n=1 Tax=Limtongia smithiae TaxID=1125753 RepID=UPI0034CE990C
MSSLVTARAAMRAVCTRTQRPPLYLRALAPFSAFSASVSPRHIHTSSRSRQRLPPLRFTDDGSLREAIVNSAEIKRKARPLRWIPAALLSGAAAAIVCYGGYKVYVLQEAIFMPYWIQPYVLEEVLTHTQLEELTELTHEAVLETLAYRDNVAAALGLPIVVEQLEDVRFTFPPDRPQEHVVKGVELYRVNRTQMLPRFKWSLRIFSLEDMYAKLISPLSAIGLGSSEDDEDSVMQDFLTAIEQRTRSWVDVTGTAVVVGAFARHAGDAESRKKRKCVVQFKGYLDLDRMNAVTIQNGVVVVYENDVAVQRIEF